MTENTATELDLDVDGVLKRLDEFETRYDRIRWQFRLKKVEHDDGKLFRDAATTIKRLRDQRREFCRRLAEWHACWAETFQALIDIKDGNVISLEDACKFPGLFPHDIPARVDLRVERLRAAFREAAEMVEHETDRTLVYNFLIHTAEEGDWEDAPAGADGTETSNALNVGRRAPAE